MNSSILNFRQCLLYEFFLGNSAAQAYKNLCVVLKEESPSQTTCQRWFNRFKTGDYSMEDEPRPGRPEELENEKLLAIVNEEPRLSTYEMEKTLGFSHTAIYNRLIKLGFVQKLGAWIPHNLSENQKLHRVSICSFLLSRKSDNEWIKQIITGDEKWVLYVNHNRKRQWLRSGDKPEPEPKGELHPKKVLMSVFWDFKGILWYNILGYGTTITANYCS
jgi:histone-lysine N-methyltransferase SETMAR